MKVSMVFDDWRQNGRKWQPKGSIYATELGIALSMGDLHSGSTFDAEVTFKDADIGREIEAAYAEHFAFPVFEMVPDGGGER